MTHFLMWYDDSPKRSIVQKIHDAHKAYADRFGVPATVAIINPDDLTSAVSGNVIVKTTVGRHTVWVGTEAPND